MFFFFLHKRCWLFNNRDNNSKTKYLHYAAILPVIYMFNYICNFHTAISSSFSTLFFFFTKHIDKPLCLGTNVLYSYATITYLHFLWYHKQRLILSNNIEVNPGDSLLLKIIDIQYLQECINFHLIIDDKLCHFITLYRSPNQCHDEFNSFVKNLKLNLGKATTFNSFLVVVLSDFNTKPSNWCINDKTNFQGAKIDTLTSQYGLHQIIKEPTHILSTSFSCIDFTS